MPNERITHPLIQTLLEKYRVIWSLNHLSALANWDISTYMPEEGSAARAEALSKVARLTQQLFLEMDFVGDIEKASREHGLNEYEQALVRLLKRSLKFYQKLPPAFVEEFTKVTSEAHHVWKKAKETNQFALFQPYLERIVVLARQKAEYLGYEQQPYDALLDEYEEGLTTSDVEEYFATLVPRLRSLLQHILRSPRYRSEHELEHEVYEAQRMEQLNQKILELVHYNLNHLRLDTAPHPFSTGIGPGDTRITTRYEGKDFRRSYTATIHEYGHALYEIQSHPDFYYTPLAGGTSLVIHESQSRFWENMVGRSRSFLAFLSPHLQLLGKKFAQYSVDELYHYLNLVKPGLIRTEADEVTYHFHVMIRFELEKALIEGKIRVAELPRVWSEQYERVLGVRPLTDSEGVLQDIHWSGGSLGYFPTYSLGTALSAMWAHRLEQALGSLSSLAGSQEGLRKIQDWLKEHIHQHGSAFPFRELVRKSVQEEFTPRYLLEYLEKKYKEVY